MAKRLQCWMGWHSYVRDHGERNPNHQVCFYCGKTRNLDNLMPPAGGGF